MIKQRKIKRYGWRPDTPDHRDIYYSVPPLVSLPTTVDMRGQCPAVYDQLSLGSCTGNAIAGLCEFLTMKEGKPAFVPSRLFIYWNERYIEGDVGQDNGAEIRDGMKVVSTLGVPHESLWWYDVNKFAVKPSQTVFQDGLKHKVSAYSRIDNTNLTSMKTCLAGGHPFVFGFTVYDSFESDSVAHSGVVPMPGKKESVLGGHATLAVGYDDTKKVFIVRNSWGVDWGMKGYFTIPYAYLTNTDLASDFWTANQIV